VRLKFEITYPLLRQLQKHGYVWLKLRITVTLDSAGRVIQLLAYILTEQSEIVTEYSIMFHVSNSHMYSTLLTQRCRAMLCARRAIVSCKSLTAWLQSFITVTYA